MKGHLFVLAAVLQWGLLGIFIKQIEGMTALGILIGRSLIGSLILGMIVLAYPPFRTSLKRSFRQIGFIFLTAAIMGMHFLTATKGYQLTTVANAALLTNTMSLFVPFLALGYLLEPIRKHELMGIIIAFSGLIIVFFEKGFSMDSGLLQGNLWAISSAILAAIYTVFSRKQADQVSPVIAMFWVCILNCIFFSVFSALKEPQALAAIDHKNLLFLLGLGLIGAFGHLCFFASLKYVKATVASALAMSSPVVAMIYAILFLSEQYSWLNAIGVLICLLGILIVIGIKPQTPWQTAVKILSRISNRIFRPFNHHLANRY